MGQSNARPIPLDKHSEGLVRIPSRLVTVTKKERYHGSSTRSRVDPEEGASMRLSRLVVIAGAVTVLALAAVAATGGASPRAAKATTITIATVNNPDMIVMESLTKNFTK